MDIIYGCNGNPISKSKNLAMLRHYAVRHRLAALCVNRDVDGEGWLNILFYNGSHFRCKFGSYELLCQWITRWKAIHGTPLFVNGETRGTVQYHAKFDIS